MSQYYSPAQVAEQLGLSEETVRRYWRRRWFTPASRTPTKISNRIRISADELDYFLSTQQEVA